MEGMFALMLLSANMHPLIDTWAIAGFSIIVIIAAIKIAEYSGQIYDYFFPIKNTIHEA